MLILLRVALALLDLLDDIFIWVSSNYGVEIFQILRHIRLGDEFDPLKDAAIVSQVSL